MCWPTQNSGAVEGLWVSILCSRFMASTGHALSWLAAMVSCIPLGKESVFEAGRVNSLYFLLSDIFMLALVMNQVLKRVPRWVLASR